MLTTLYFDLLTSAVFFPVTASFKSTHFYPIIPDKANYLRISVLKSFFSLLHAMSFRISLFSISLSDLHWEIIVLFWLSEMEVKTRLYTFIISRSLGTYHFTEAGRCLYIFQFQLFLSCAISAFPTLSLTWNKPPKLAKLHGGLFLMSGLVCWGWGVADSMVLLTGNSGG